MAAKIPAAFLTVSRRKKSSLRRRELEPAGRPAEIGEKEAQGGRRKEEERREKRGEGEMKKKERKKRKKKRK